MCRVQPDSFDNATAWATSYHTWDYPQHPHYWDHLYLNDEWIIETITLTFSKRPHDKDNLHSKYINSWWYLNCANGPFKTSTLLKQLVLGKLAKDLLLTNFRYFRGYHNFGFGSQRQSETETLPECLLQRNWTKEIYSRTSNTKQYSLLTAEKWGRPQQRRSTKKNFGQIHFRVDEESRSGPLQSCCHICNRASQGIRTQRSHHKILLRSLYT